MNNIFFITFSKYAFSVSSLLQNDCVFTIVPLPVHVGDITFAEPVWALFLASDAMIWASPPLPVVISPLLLTVVVSTLDELHTYSPLPPFTWQCTCNYKNKFNKYILIHVYTCICEFLDIQINFHLNIRQHTLFSCHLCWKLCINSSELANSSE